MGVILTGHIEVPEDRLPEIEVALAEHIRLTRAEPGCETFEVTPDPAVQGRFLVAERFTDRAAFDAHQVRTRASAWWQISKDLPRDFRAEETEA